MQPSPTSDVVVGGIAKRERFWVQHYTWLEKCGYRLRKRFAPDWIPSWLGTNKLLDYFEDSRSVFVRIPLSATSQYLISLLQTPQICDATRISDGAFVSLKKLSKSVYPFEVSIGRYFSSEPLASDPRNHCAPFIDVLQVPYDDDLAVVVMPLLRYYDNPRFDTFGEAVDFFHQVIEVSVAFNLKHFISSNHFPDARACNLCTSTTLLIGRW